MGDPFAMLRRDYMVICEDACAALLLQVFEEWTNSKLKNAEDLPGTTWVYRTIEELARIDLCGAFGRDRVSGALSLLLELGLIERRRNPDPKYGYDRTYQYRLCRWRLQALVDQVGCAIDRLESQSRKSDDGKRRHDYRTSEIRLSMSGNPTSNTSESPQTSTETRTNGTAPRRNQDHLEGGTTLERAA